MYMKASEPQSVGKVLDNGIRLFKASLPRVLLPAFLASTIITLPSLIFPGFLAGDPAVVTTDTLATIAGTYSVMGLAFVIVSLAFYNAIVYHLDAVMKGTEAGPGEALGAGFKKLPSVLVMTMLFGLAVLLGLMLLVIPGVILMVSLMFGLPLIVLDDEGPLSALKQSHHLVWRNWWRTAAVLTVPFILYFVFILVVETTLGVLAGVQLISTQSMVFKLSGIIIDTLMMPLLYAIYLAQLNDLKLRKQGLDLKVRLAPA